MDKLILVTGSTGYIASRLIPRVLDSGYRVRCLARNPLRLTGRSWLRDIEVVQGDVTIPSTLHGALKDVHTAYYLIHNMTRGHGYTALELDSARAFASAAEKAAIEHVIYLGGLADLDGHIAPHMRSRIETGHVLREGKVPVTEFRAGVIIGSGSISFEMIRFMTELFPIVPGPRWLRNKSQPIAIQNVVDYLIAALENKKGWGDIFEIGGPETTEYGQLMMRYACVRELKRRLLLLPGIPLWFMASGVGLMTPVPYPIAYALIDGLSADSIVKHSQALETFPEVKLIGFDPATKDALEKTHPLHIERVWDDGKKETKSIKHEGCFIEHHEVTLSTGAEKVFRTIRQFVDQSSWHTEVDYQEKILVCIENQFAGKKWIEWRIRSHAKKVTLTQTVFFSLRGLPGFLYWYLLYPLHLLRFRNLIDKIAKQSENR